MARKRRVASVAVHKNNESTTRIGSTFKVSNILLQGVTRARLDFTQRCIEDGDVQNTNVGYQNLNDFPQYISGLVGRSPVARACYRVVQNYMKGAGFVVEEGTECVGKLKTWYGSTVLSSYEATTIDFALLDRFAIRVHFEYNQDAGVFCVSGFDVLEVENCRYGLPNEKGEVKTVVYNPFFNTVEQSQKTQWVEYPLFDLNTVAEDYEQFVKTNSHKSLGVDDFAQVIFFNTTTPINRVYSRPEIVSAEFAMQADASVWQFHAKNLQNNGYAGGIITIVGDPSEPVETHPTTGEVTLTLQEDFENNLQNKLLGVENAGNFVTMFVKGSNPIFPKIEPFANNNDNDTRFLGLPEPLKEVITTAWNVPSVLANIQIGGKLGNTQEVELAIMQMNNNVRSKVEILENTFSMLLTLMYKTPICLKVVPISPVLEIPQWVFENLSATQKAQYIKTKYGIKKEDFTNEPTTNTFN